MNINENIGRTVLLRKIATIYLVCFCIQIVPIEGMGVSWLKVLLMLISPFLIVKIMPQRSKPFLWGALYFLTVVLCACSQTKMRWTTIAYFGFFILTYILFYSLIYKHVFSLDYYIILLKRMIISFFVILLLQQLCMLIGIHYMPLVNLSDKIAYSLTKLPSLSIEPSHAARILGTLFLSYLFCCQLKMGHNLKIQYLFKGKHKLILFAFLWTMTTMGSATAFIMIAIISFFFLRRRTLLFVTPLLIIIAIILVSMNLEQVQRIMALSQAIGSNEGTAILMADPSGAQRILPLFNTINEFDLSSKSFLFGNGTIMEAFDLDEWKEVALTKKITTIEQYGFVSWVVSLFFLYKCAIRRFFSLETIIFIVALSFDISNVAYVWGIIMLFTVIKYFDITYKYSRLT